MPAKPGLAFAPPPGALEPTIPSEISGRSSKVREKRGIRSSGPLLVVRGWERGGDGPLPHLLAISSLLGSVSKIKERENMKVSPWASPHPWTFSGLSCSGHSAYLMSLLGGGLSPSTITNNNGSCWLWFYFSGLGFDASLRGKKPPKLEGDALEGSAALSAQKQKIIKRKLLFNKWRITCNFPSLQLRVLR